MMWTSEVYVTKPTQYKTELEEKVYETLEELKIPYYRVETEPLISMEDCLVINEKLQMKTVKTLFLCNQQKTKFYLCIMPGDKRFDCKVFSRALQIARVSFGSEQLMNELLETQIGACSIFSALIDKENKVQIVIDQDVLKEEDYGCSDGTTTGYMKIKTKDVLEKILPYAHHTPIIVTL